MNPLIVLGAKLERLLRVVEMLALRFSGQVYFISSRAGEDSRVLLQVLES